MAKTTKDGSKSKPQSKPKSLPASETQPTPLPLTLTDTDAGLQFQASLDFIAEGIGGTSTFLEHCAASTSDRLQAFIATYRALPTTERTSVTLQDLCTRSGLKPAEVMSDFVSTVIFQQNNLALLVSALQRPAIMQASIDSAMVIGPDGVQDRKFQFEMGGLLKSGPSIVNQLGIRVDTGGDLPSFEEDSTFSARSVQERGQAVLPEPLQGVVLRSDLDVTEQEASLVPAIPKELD